MNSNHETGQASDHSDSDDWLFVPRPTASGSNSTQESFGLSSLDSRSDQISIEGHSLDGEPATLKKCSTEEDGLTEIDLNSSILLHSSQKSSKNKLDIIEENEDDDEDKMSENEPVPASSSSEPSMSEFQVLDNSTDNELDTLEYSGSTSNKRQSLSDSDLNDYIDIGRKRKKRVIIVEEAEIATKHFGIHDEDAQSIDEDGLETKQRNIPYNLSMIKERMDELSEAVRVTRINSTEPNVSLSEMFNIQQNKYLFIVSALAFGYLSALFFFTISLSTIKQQKQLQNSPEFNFSELNFVPTSQQYKELRALNNDLSKCIKRQHPASFTGYSSPHKYHQDDSKPENVNRDQNEKGSNLVCYGHESEWRQRFDRLESEHHLNFGKIVNDARRRIANEILEKHHPVFQFKLILHQLDYLEFLENKRQRRKTEDTIKYLKAQNLNLLRRLNHSNDREDSQRIIANLEFMNARLKAENKALRTNLMQKAGPTFIKQSQELEKLEAENNVLKDFHHDVARQVSSSLRQMNVYTTEKFNNLDDSRLLSPQLIATRDNLERLKDKISTILLENESLKAEIKETYSLTISNLPNVPLHYGLSESKSIIHNGSDNPLTTESCARDLINSKKTIERQQKEILKLKSDCNKMQAGVNLQTSSGNFLNKTSPAKRVTLGLVARLETAVEKPSVNAYSLRSTDLFDGIMAVSFDKEQKGSSFFSTNLLEAKENESTLKVLPNYIRETYAQRKAYQSSEVSTPTSLGNYRGALTINTAQPLLLPELENLTKKSVDNDHIHESTSRNDWSQKETSYLSATSEERLLDPVEETIASKNKTSWFFKRAKQRKELRRNKENFKKRIHLGKGNNPKSACMNSYLGHSANHGCMESIYGDLPHNKRKFHKVKDHRQQTFSDRKYEEKTKKSNKKKHYNNKVGFDYDLNLPNMPNRYFVHNEL